MSRYFSEKYSRLVPYTPGEQPARGEISIKLNTNESPYPPTEKAIRGAAEAAAYLNLYSDPEAKLLRAALAERLGVEPDEVLPTNGSDEILNFAFMAFCDEGSPAIFPDITYGFYPVFADLNGVPYRTIPLKDDFTIDPADYYHAGGTVFIANPNAPTGIALTLAEVESIVAANRDNVVVIDEAYVDFGGESAVSLIHKYDNLLVTQTFSKSRSLAGARLGFGVGCVDLIRDLNTVKYSTNPYNVNSLTMAAGLGMLADDETVMARCQKIAETRDKTAAEMQKMGFTLTESRSNFLFAAHPAVEGDVIYRELRKRGILVRHFTGARIRNYNRITVGTPEQMEALLGALRDILAERT